MSFPNALKGIKKMFAAEILSLISVAVLLISSVVNLLSGMIAEEDSSISGATESFFTANTAIGLISGILFFASGIAIIVGFILKLIGLKQAGHDEDKFNAAFALQILSLILMVGYGIFNSINNLVANISYSVATVFELIAIILVLQGIMNLSLSPSN